VEREADICSSAENFSEPHIPVAAEKIFSENDSPVEEGTDLVKLLTSRRGYCVDGDESKN
jgi:hypothetical protein